MKRILHVVSVLDLGGTEAFIMNNYRILDRSKIQFDFLVFQKKEHPYVPEIEKLGGRIFYTEMIPSLGNMREFSERFKAIVDENGPYDAIHTHVNLRNSFPLKAAYECGIPLRISHSHATHLGDVGGMKSFATIIKKHMIKKYATDFLACSEAAGSILYGNIFFKKNGQIIPNGIDVERFLKKNQDSSKRLRRDWNLPDNCPLTVGNISRFDANKNCLFTIRVFNEILKKEPGAILIMGGPDGGLFRDCEKMVSDLGIKNSVRFIGKRNDITDCLKEIDLYLFPSKTEGLGIGLLEAQASGCLSVASTSIPRMVDVGLNAICFIDLREPAEFWAQKALEAVSNWHRSSENTTIRCFADAGFDIHAAHKALVSVYEKNGLKK